MQLAANDINAEALQHQHLFSKFGSKLKGNYLDGYEEVIEACDDRVSLKNRVFYSQFLFKVRQKWQKCVSSGSYHILKGITTQNFNSLNISFIVKKQI